MNILSNLKISKNIISISKIFNYFISADYLPQTIKNEFCKLFNLSTIQIYYLKDYILSDYTIEYYNLTKEAFLNTFSKHEFDNLLKKYDTIIIDRIEFEKNDFKNKFKSETPSVIYSSGNLKEEYLKRFKRKPKRRKSSVEFMRINDYVYRVDNLKF